MNLGKWWERGIDQDVKHCKFYAGKNPFNRSALIFRYFVIDAASDVSYLRALA